jgi:hypothetical protein
VAHAVAPSIAPAILLEFLAQIIHEENAVREDEQQDPVGFFASLDEGCAPATRPLRALRRPFAAAPSLMSSTSEA